MNEIIHLLKNLADNNPYGNPFSAIIINTKSKRYYCAVNEIKLGDQTAHAEMVALRKLKETNYKPKDCIIISSGEPCPMCLTAIAWSGIKKVRYLDSYSIANKRGFKFDQSCHRVNKLLKLGLNIKKIKWIN